MDLVQYDPFSLLRDVERMFEPQGTAQRTWMPRIDVFDNGTDLVVRVEIPGIDASAVDVTIEDRTLTISGSRPLDESVETIHRREILTGEFKRTVVLPEGIDGSAITAQAANGLLDVTLPRRPEVLPRTVKVAVSS